MKKKFSFSQKFINKIIEQTGGILTSDQFEELVSCLENEASKYYFNSNSEANLIRIFSSIYDRIGFTFDLIKYPHRTEVIIAIAANSNYLTDIVVRNPEYLYQVFDQKYLSVRIDDVLLRNEVRKGIANYKSITAKLNYLRQFKKRYILKIGLTDVLKIENVANITGQLSVLANTICAELFAQCYDSIAEKYQLTFKKCKYALCSLGKLGGNELNYSSDVDLILFYDENQFYKSVNKEYHEILSEAAQLFTKSASEISEKGYIYRIDFRLRPDGKYSPLCKSISDYTKYYELRGENWERQMLIKFNFIGGNESLFKYFYDFLQPFIYPVSLSNSIKEVIARMKQNIEMNNNQRENIKLFHGGIRDIEFSVQALQLLNGGKYPELKTGNTLKAISSLYEKELLVEKERNIFTEAYFLYRRIEHFLQLMNDTQTHQIPDDKEMLLKLCNYLRYSSIKEFKNSLSKTRKDVRNIYNSILSANPNEKLIIDLIDFKDKTRAKQNFSFLQFGIGVFGQRQFDQRIINNYNVFKTELIKYLVKSESPDAILENLVKLIRSVPIVSIWYNEFKDNTFFKSILKLCEFSNKSINIVTVDRHCEELLLTRKVFENLSDEELNQLSVNQIIFILSVQSTLGLIEAEDLSQKLSCYIINKINCFISHAKLKQKFFIASLGSLSLKTMSFSSDIDLLCVSKETDINSNIQKDFQELNAHLQKILAPFSIDFRLRPEGKSSQLVWSSEKILEYFTNRARIWEYQAFLKINFIAGDNILYDQFKSKLIDIMKKLNPEFVLKEIKEMEIRVQKELINISGTSFNIKKEKGGLGTIDFILDSIAFLFPNLMETTIGIERNKIFQILGKTEIKRDIKLLSANFRLLKILEIGMQNIYDSNSSLITSDNEKRTQIFYWMQKFYKFNLDTELNQIIKQNKLLFEKYVG